jgi:SagB-type dehydrogenase family enzyme
MIKYGERGYRFIMLEIGFVSENISLICDGLGLGSCMAGGYLDNEINDMLEIDGTFETVQNVIIVGKK